MLKNEFLNQYREYGFNNVQGWCSHRLFEIIDLLDGADINKDGGCLEIGVHHGKFYILLNGVIDHRFKSYAVDVYENQSLNIDGSGKGDLNTFKENLIIYDRHKGSNTEIISGDSTDLKVMKLLDDKLSSFRFVSVDGGHTAEHTISDLKFASRLITNQGVVILDDILNYHWPGVIEGVVIFLSQKQTLIPFAIGNNKLLLAKLTYRNFYFDLFNNSCLKSKVVNFFGHPVVAL